MRERVKILCLSLFSESTVSFAEVNFKRSEGEPLDIPVYRTGDLSEELVVICSTVQSKFSCVLRLIPLGTIMGRSFLGQHKVLQ